MEARELSGKYKPNEPIRCPHCHRPLLEERTQVNGYIFHGDFIETPEGYSFKMSPACLRIIEILFLHKDQVVRLGKIYSMLYGERIDGGPGQDTIKVHVARIREAFKIFEFPYRIDTVVSLGYKLVALEQSK